MSIIDILNKNKVTISFEVFPPKKETNFSEVEKAARQIADLHPNFMSVTYGAGGTNNKNTAHLAADIQNKTATPGPCPSDLCFFYKTTSRIGDPYI